MLNTLKYLCQFVIIFSVKLGKIVKRHITWHKLRKSIRASANPTNRASWNQPPSFHSSRSAICSLLTYRWGTIVLKTSSSLSIYFYYRCLLFYIVLHSLLFFLSWEIFSTYTCYSGKLAITMFIKQYIALELYPEIPQLNILLNVFQTPKI